MALTEQAHQLITSYFADKDTSVKFAIDATCGNGFDTLFLAELGFSHVYAFDLQQQAIDNTRHKLNQTQLANVTLVHASHAAMQENVNTLGTKKVDCIMFNLGYLPSADKNITTVEKTTLKALEDSLGLLNNNGILSILCYPGHPEGAKETTAIQVWLQNLEQPWTKTVVQSSHPSPKSPILYLIQYKIT